MVFPQISFLFWDWFRTVLVYSLYGAVAAAIFCIINELGVFVVQGWTGDMAAGVERSGPTEIMTAWRWSLVTITATGLATLKVGELTQMLVSGGGNVGSGASTRAVQTEAVAAWQCREEPGRSAGVRGDRKPGRAAADESGPGPSVREAFTACPSRPGRAA